MFFCHFFCMRNLTIFGVSWLFCSVKGNSSFRDDARVGADRSILFSLKQQFPVLTKLHGRAKQPR